MLKGKTLVELAAAVTENVSRKMDVVSDTRKLSLMVDDSKKDGANVAHITTADVDAILTPHALSQITAHTGIPKTYADRMLQAAPALLERNVNHWFANEPSLRMVRTLRNGSLHGRAFLSNRYHRMENEAILASVLPELLNERETGALEVLSTELTDTRMYVKVVFPRMEGEVKRGDVVQYGFTLANSEIGLGAMSLTPFVYRLACLNGMTVPKDVDDTRMRRAHLGRQLEEGADFYTGETIAADDRALALKLRDTLRAFRDPSRWQSVLSRMQAAAQTDQAVNPIATVERVAEMLMLPKAEHNDVLTNFLRDGDLTKWGLLNAVTAVANKSESYDRAVELEQAGGRILALPSSDWSRLAKAA